MRRGTIIVLLVVGAVLLPTWYVGIQGAHSGEGIELDQSVSDIRPLDGFLDTPTELSPSQVGVIVWIALFVMLGVLAFFHRFMNRAVRPSREPRARDAGKLEEVTTDGGRETSSWLETEDRWIVEYIPASDAIEGLLVIGALTALTIVFAALFTGEYFNLARTQYFGIYAFGMFMSLTGLTVSYYAWFMPHVEVAERREH
jgi:hypothetical protein